MSKSSESKIMIIIGRVKKFRHVKGSREFFRLNTNHNMESSEFGLLNVTRRRFIKYSDSSRHVMRDQS